MSLSTRSLWQLGLRLSRLRVSKGFSSSWLGTPGQGQWLCRACLHSSSSGSRRPDLFSRTTQQLRDGKRPMQARCESSEAKSRDDTPKTAAGEEEEARVGATAAGAAESTSTASTDTTSTHTAAAEFHSPSSSSKSSNELPSQEEERRSSLSRRFRSAVEKLQPQLMFAGQRLNEVTGYSGIEQLKREVQAAEGSMQGAEASLAEARASYDGAIAQRSDSQRESNELLQRQSTWSPVDIERYTALIRRGHEDRLRESGARQRLADAERAADEAGRRYYAKIRERYYEEQIWSDKIRHTSNLTAWGLMGLNFILFLVLQLGLEPWRRRRLVRGFEEKVKEALENGGGGSAARAEGIVETNGSGTAAATAPAAAALATSASQMQADAEEAVETVVAEEVSAAGSGNGNDTGIVATPEPSIEAVPLEGPMAAWTPDLGKYKKSLEELFSERQVTVRQVDLMQKALEGLFAGVFLTSIIATLVRGR